MNLYMIDNLLFLKDCPYETLVGNGQCNDESNIVECYYDGADCCNHPNLIGNGFCNDETNVPECIFDGGDCCGSCINIGFCKNCICYGNLTLSGVSNPLIGDGYCNDELNFKECNFDGGDCCNNDYENWDIYCQTCECHQLRLVYCF